MSEVFVLDASALLCLLNCEPGADRVAEVLAKSVIGAVNVSEVVAKLAESGGRQDRIEAALRVLHLKIVPFDHVQAVATGVLRPQTKALGLSLGDRACLALAKYLSATALTTDRAWRGLPEAIGVEVEVIR